MDLPTLRQVRKRWSPPAATGLGNARQSRQAGIRDAVELDWWQSTELAGSRVTYVRRNIFPREPCSIVTGPCGRLHRRGRGAVVYFAGDSGYGSYFAEIGRRFPRIDLALLPIGAYEPRWFMRTHHMNPEEAVRAHCDLRARRGIGMHFGTFQLTDEAIDAPCWRCGEKARPPALKTTNSMSSRSAKRESSRFNTNRH